MVNSKTLLGVNLRQTTLSQCGPAHLIHRAPLKAYAGRIQPAGRMLPTPAPEHRFDGPSFGAVTAIKM